MNATPAHAEPTPPGARRFLMLFAMIAALGFGGCKSAPPKTSTHAVPQPVKTGGLEVVATFDSPMPTGVAVSHEGRIFVNFPRWGDPVAFTVAEIRNGRAIPFPNAAINTVDTNRAAECFISVQSVLVDARNRLWVLDTGSLNMASTLPEGPKLVGIDLSQNRVFQTIPLPPTVVWPTSYLNDLRIDLRKGVKGVAYITDSSDKGPNGIVVVDLARGRAWRMLDDHPSTKAEPNFIATVEGRPLLVRKPGEPEKPLGVGSDGIALSADGSRLYYSALAGRRLFSVPTQALQDADLAAPKVAATVRDEGAKPASDGLESDAQGRLYVTDYEHNAIARRTTDGRYETLIQDPRILWPDTLCLATDGYLYFIANQLHRQPIFHSGQDLRARPYSLFRLRVNATPVLLRYD